MDRGIDVALDTEQHQAVMQWELKESGALDGTVHIQVGTLADGGWYVRHMGFGGRRFEDKQAAWRATQGLMSRHQGRWEQATLNPGPFSAVCRPDGSRVLYDMNDDACLYACWGDQKDRLWGTFSAAIGAGATLRRTMTHALFDGYIELVRYRDPMDGSERYVVVTARDPGSDYRVVDYPDHWQADTEYENSVVYANADDEFPYKSSDIKEIRVDRKSKPPEGLTVLPDGTILDTGDLDEYDRLYGLPLRTEWPAAEPAIPSGAVCGMTTEPRDWGPAEVRIRDVTPAAWDETDEELRPNALALVALPDGRQLLASCHDDAAHVWSIGDGKSVRVVSGHSEWVLSVALTVRADGNVVMATGGKDGLARIWSARQGDPLQEVHAHRRAINSVAWACPPGQTPWLVTGSDDATVRVWDVATKRSLGVLEVGTSGVNLVWSVATAVLSDGDVCVVAASDDMDAATVHVWNATTGTTSHEFAIEHDDSTMTLPKVAVATLADRSFRVAAIAGAVVRVWDGHTGQVVRTLSVPDDGAGDNPGDIGGDVALAVLPDLRVIVAATSSRTTLVWDVESSAVLAQLGHDVGGVSKTVDLVARPDGGLLLVTGREGDSPARVRRLDLRW